MTAIADTALIEFAVKGRPYRIRTAAAQATTGQTDWLRVPNWATYLWLYIDVTATAGTTPIFLPQLQVLEPITKDTANQVQIGGAMTGGITSTGQINIYVGPGVTGIADATLALNASGASKVEYNQVLPAVLGVKCVNDRTTGDETYTYTITAMFR